MTGIVTDIRRFSLHDGPGIRTTVFLKGCNLRCRWCHNPETYEQAPQLVFAEDTCIGCHACYEACRTGALSIVDGKRVYDRGACEMCGDCVDACYPGALRISGLCMTVDEVMSQILRDSRYYENSGGGVTISGGEPFAQGGYLHELLRACRSEGIHTAVETNLLSPWESILYAIDAIDLVMADIKVFDRETHIGYTGASNDRILRNIELLDTTNIEYIIRTPVVPGVNDSEKAIGDIARFLASLHKIRYYELLNYNELAESKFRWAGLPYSMKGAKTLGAERMHALERAARIQAPELEIHCRI